MWHGISEMMTGMHWAIAEHGFKDMGTTSHTAKLEQVGHAARTEAIASEIHNNPHLTVDRMQRIVFLMTPIAHGQLCLSVKASH